MKCPCCNGKGGEIEPVLDYGQGPYYPCGLCNDKLTVSIFKWLWWKWADRERPDKKKSLLVRMNRLK